MDRDKKPKVKPTFEDACRKLKFRLRNVPPGGQLVVRFFRDDADGIRDHKVEQVEDGLGPISLDAN